MIRRGLDGGGKEPGICGTGEKETPLLSYDATRKPRWEVQSQVGRGGRENEGWSQKA